VYSLKEKRESLCKARKGRKGIQTKGREKKTKKCPEDKDGGGKGYPYFSWGGILAISK